jgi:hypothetical protein
VNILQSIGLSGVNPPQKLGILVPGWKWTVASWIEGTARPRAWRNPARQACCLLKAQPVYLSLRVHDSVAKE